MTSAITVDGHADRRTCSPGASGHDPVQLDLRRKERSVHFRGFERRAQVAIEVASDGLFIFVEGFEFPVVKVDLFYLLESIEGKTAPQLIAYDTQHEEAVAFAAFHLDGTRVSFETGVEEIGKDNFGDAVYGYSPEPMTSDNT